MKLIPLIIALIVSGCACKEVIKPPIIQTVTVEVPVPVKCKIVWPEKVKHYMSEKSGSDSVLDKGNALIAENISYEAYTTALEVAVKECLSK